MGLVLVFLCFWTFMASIYLLICIMAAMPGSSYDPFISRLNKAIISFGKAYNESSNDGDDPAFNAVMGYLLVLPAYLPFVVLYYLIIAPVILLVEFINDRL